MYYYMPAEGQILAIYLFIYLFYTNKLFTNLFIIKKYFENDSKI